MSPLDKRLIEDLGRLLSTPDRQKMVAKLKARGGIDARTGTGTPGAASDVGIASPLTELDAATREYWPERTIQSDYALFAVRLKPLKTVYMEDANGNDVVLQFDEPPV